MATMRADFGVNLTNLNLHWFWSNYTREDLYPNAKVNAEGKTYRVALDIQAYNGVDRDLFFLGSNIKGSAYEGTVSGTVQAVGEAIYDYDQGAWSYYYGIYGINLSAKSILEAAKTTSTRDDKDLLIKALAKGDLFKLSDYDDYISGFGGNDTMKGYGGDDSLQGGTGRDQLYGGSGADDFIFNDGDMGKGGNRDVIFDFRVGLDDLDLGSVDASSKKGIRILNLAARRRGAMTSGTRNRVPIWWCMVTPTAMPRPILKLNCVA